MQEEVTQKTIALVFKSSRLTADVLKKAMNAGFSVHEVSCREGRRHL